MKEIVLVVVAHPDDESISMGGTIYKHTEKGDKVYVISMTDGVSARSNVNKDDVIVRKKAADQASEILGFKWGQCFDFKDNLMDSYSMLDIVKAIEESKKEYKPTLVYTHSSADLNVDHRVVTHAVLTAFRPQPMEICKEIRLFEVASATDYGAKSVTGSFNPNLFVNISNFWKLKSNALDAYSTEIRKSPHSRSKEGIKNLAKLRGSQVGFNLAEAFEVVRKLID